MTVSPEEGIVRTVGDVRAVPTGRTCKPESSGRRAAPVSSTRIGRAAGRCVSDEYSGSKLERRPWSGAGRPTRCGRSYSIDMS